MSGEGFEDGTMLPFTQFIPVDLEVLAPAGSVETCLHHR